MAIIGANEIYRKLSSQIEAQFPEFLREDGPKFIAFLRAYYEYMEQTGKAGDAQRSLFDTTDIDRTVSDFVQYFHREFMQSIPRNVLTDKRLLAKYIREFYRSRGSQQSYRFLFRILFDKEIEFYYPGDDILRASDGRWVRETVIRGVLSAGCPETMDGREITGATSGAKGRVQEVLHITSLGISLIQLRVENTTGTFLNDEIVSDGLGNSIRISNTTGSLSDVAIVDGGAYNSAGDIVTVSGTAGGSATATVTSTKDTGGLTFRIVKGGSGYRISNTTINIVDGDPSSPASFRIVSLSNTEVILIGQDLINSVKNVILSTGATFATGGSNSTTLTASLAAANISSTLTSALTFSNTTVGSISSIFLIDPGYGYGYIPPVSVIDEDVSSNNISDGHGGFKGRNAVIVANNTPGIVTGISITTSDVNFLKGDIATITNTSRSAANTSSTSADAYNGLTRTTIRKGYYAPNGNFTIASSFQLPGRYLDTKGFLSWNNKLQDNYYYQEFSYDIKASELVDSYRRVIRDLLNPAGTKMFGTYTVESFLDASSFLDVDSNPDVAGSEVGIEIEIGITESITLADSIRAGIPFSDSVAESVTAGDSFNTTATFAPAVAETGSAADAVDATNSTSAAVAESGTASDSLEFTFTVGGGVTESVTATDVVNAMASMVAAIQEVSGLIQEVQSELISSYQSVTIAEYMDGKHNLEDAVSRS